MNIMEDKRLVFDTIPDHFDKWRGHYSKELFDYIVKTCSLTKDKRCLEIGPGTGQATDFALETGCDYTAIELGSNLSRKMSEKYGGRSNFRLINADFAEYPFEPQSFDLVYSAAAVQWVGEVPVYTRTFEILKNGGYLAMFYMSGDYKTPSPELYDKIQSVYDSYFVSDSPYRQKFDYTKGAEYGFEYLGETKFHGNRHYSADEYIEFIKTHSNHITLNEKYRDVFFRGIYDAVSEYGGINFDDTYHLHLCRKL